MKTLGRDANARYLNSLPQAHWDKWFATERAVNKATDRNIADGMAPIAAYEAAIAEVIPK